MHHFSAGGLYNGLILLIDDETRTYWDHITGDAIHGPLAGKKLDMWGIEQTNVEVVRKKYGDILLYRSRPSWLARLMPVFSSVMTGRFPPGFRKTMGAVDTRLPEMEVGLGIITDEGKRFYPQSTLKERVEDTLAGRSLSIEINNEDGVPVAVWSDGSRPVQMLNRWYGFSLTFPGCEIYESTGENR